MLSWQAKMISLPKSSLTADMKWRKSDPTQSKFKKETLLSRLNWEKLTEVLKSKSNFSKKKGFKATSFMRLTFKNSSLCLRIKSKKARRSVSNATIFWMKRKPLKLDSKKKRTNSKISCQELHMTCKENFNTQRKNKQLKNSLKSKT